MTTITLILIAFILGQFVGLFVGWELSNAPIVNDQNQ